MDDRRPDYEPLTIPRLIRRRRLARLRRRALTTGALLGCLCAGLAVAGLAVGDDATTTAACTDTAMTTTVAVPDPQTTVACDPLVANESAPPTTDTVPATTTEGVPSAETTLPSTPTETVVVPPAQTTATEPVVSPPAETTATEPVVPPVETTTTAPAVPAPETPKSSATIAIDATPVAVRPPAQHAPIVIPAPRLPRPAPQRPKPAAWPGMGPEDQETASSSKAGAQHPAAASRDAGAASSQEPAAADPQPGPVAPPAPQPTAFAAAADLSLPPLATGDATSFPGPEVLLPIYQAAAAEYHVPWSVLAAINEIETGFGKNQGPSSAGAVGWMQFMPSTWAQHGLDANGDGIADPSDPVDAIFTAAEYLRAAGGEGDIRRAVFAYNHAGWYVDKVLARAAVFQDIDPQVLTALTYRGMGQARTLYASDQQDGFLAPGTPIDSLGRAMLLGDKELGEQVIRDADIYPCGQQDITAGRIDRRVLIVIEALAKEKLHPTISSLECGHSFLTSSGNQSEHTTGTAVDIAAVNGTPILGHQGAGSITETVLHDVLALPGFLTAHQVISLMTVAGFPNTMAMSDHNDHVHVGFRPLSRS